MLQSLAFQKLHGEKRLAFVLSDLINRADIRMVESRGGLRLALKPLQRLTILGKGFGQELNGDEAMQPQVLGLVDHTHAPGTQSFQDAVVGDKLPNHGENPTVGCYLSPSPRFQQGTLASRA